jgi:hypothetical protein
MTINTISECSNICRDVFENEIIPAGKPVLLKQLVRDWPATIAAQKSNQDLAVYLKELDNGQNVNVMFGRPEMEGRYFYDDSFRGFNFENGKARFVDVIDQLLSIADTPNPMAIYAGSAQANDLVPEFASQNIMPILGADIEPRLWLGNSSRVAAHYDNSDNIACLVSGRRRFTLFPPDQIGNLYIGPLDFNMAGQPASLVDFNAPDFDRFPKFRAALDAAIVINMEPGDAIYMPSLWWHHVESEGSFNLLVNYWWQSAGDGPAFESLVLALIGIRDRSPSERAAWRAYFEHYVFGDAADHAGDHIPPHANMILGPPREERTQRMIQFVMSRLGQR